jgi:hypothetical protein
MLEGLHRGARPVAEIAVGVDQRATGEDGGQPALNIRDRGSLVAEGEWQTYRYAAISWSN